MKKLIAPFLLCLLWSSCKNKDDDAGSPLTPNDLHVKLSIEGNYLFEGQQGWAILSDLDGTVLTCQVLQNGTVLDLQNEVPFFGNDFHLTLVKKTYSPSDEWGYPDVENISFETFAFIKKDSLAIVVTEPEQFPAFYPRAYIQLNINNGPLENFVVSSTLTANKGEAWSEPKQVGMKRDAGDVYLIVKMQNEQGWRHAFFEEVPAGTTVQTNTSGMAQIPTSFVQVPTEYESDLAILGIRTCGSNEFLSLQWFVSGENGAIPARYSEGIFEKYRSTVTLTKNNEEFQLQKLGSPITAYMPSPLGFNVGNESIKNFKLTHDNDFTAFEAEWAHEIPGNDVYKTASWKVWSAFPAAFVAPDLPACISGEIDWLETSDFGLKSVKKKRFSSFGNFQDFVDYHLQHQIYDLFRCTQYNFNGEGSLEVKTRYFN
jgi:hypothetical protein